MIASPPTRAGPSSSTPSLTKEGARHPGDDKAVEVLNGGGPGWGIFQMERYLRRAVPRFAPDVVFLTITPIDIYRQPFSEEELGAYLKGQERRKHLRDTSIFLTFLARRVAPDSNGQARRPQRAWRRSRQGCSLGGRRRSHPQARGRPRRHDEVRTRRPPGFQPGARLGSPASPVSRGEIAIDYFDLAPAYVGADSSLLHVPGTATPTARDTPSPRAPSLP